MRTVRRVSNSRIALRAMYYLWVVFPYPIRKPLTALFILWVLGMKKLLGVNRSNNPTPMEDMGNLSFWGVPHIEADTYALEISGEVDSPLRCTFDDLKNMESVERPIRMDCVGGFRNNSTMKGVPLKTLFDMAQVRPEADAVVFRCADGYFTAHLVSDLLKSEAFMVYEMNGQRIERFGHPLRLAAPGTYGYKWAKWVVKIEFVRGFPKGHWEQKGLPRRGKIGDVW